MLIQDITAVLEEIAPIHYAESYDNSGLIIGNPKTKARGALLCLDVTLAVLKEAEQKSCNLIICHHPLIFKGLKKIQGNNEVEQCVIYAIQKEIAIYACHTNLDNVLNRGVNQKIAQKLRLTDLQILKPMQNELVKCVTYCPEPYAEEVTQAMWKAGAGQIGNYNNCSFTMEGTGTFQGNEFTTPFLGTRGELEKVIEKRIEVLLEKHKVNQVLQALRESHPYEEVAYEVMPILNTDTTKGAGLIGSTQNPMSGATFLEHVKEALGLQVIKHTAPPNAPIERVALCGGSGSFLTHNAMKAQAQVFISADFKYHDYFETSEAMMICDIGHYESEIFTLEIFMEIIKEKFPTFAVLFTEISSNPVNYYH